MEEEFEALTIPSQIYAKFTSDSGIIPKIVINMWQNIWKMEDASGLNGQRAYLADFEMYDERSMDINNAVVDIYIGIKA